MVQYLRLIANRESEDEYQKGFIDITPPNRFGLACNSLEFSERLDEELDTGLTQTVNEWYDYPDTPGLKIAPFSLAALSITDDDGNGETRTFPFFLTTNISHHSSVLTVEEIELVELTRWLMGIMIDGRKVTQPISGEKKDLGTVCDELLQTERLQGHSIPMTGTISRRRFFLSQNTKDELNKVISPEFHWEAGTLLWECLLDIGNVINAIPRLTLNPKESKFEIVFTKLDDLEYEEYDGNIWELQ